MQDGSTAQEGRGHFQTRPRWRLEGLQDAASPRPLLVALHGMGQDLDIMAGQIAPLRSRDGLLLLPDAPLPFERKAEGGERGLGHAWYVYTGDQADFLAWAERAEAYLLGLIDDLIASGVADSERVSLIGYSQGGYLAGILALRNPERFRAAIIVNARVKHEVAGQPSAAASRPEFLVLHGEHDRFIPLDAARASTDQLAASGTEAQFEAFPSGHRFSEDQAARARDWLDERGL